jgi:hypothetical protein
MSQIIKDLVVLVADADMEATCRGLLHRRETLRIKDITWDIFRHLQRDAGCCGQSHDFLRPFAKQYRYALVIFDHEGCGQEKKHSSDLEDNIQRQLEKNGWDDRAKVVVIEPELEIWVWSDSPQVDKQLGWKVQEQEEDLRTWLLNENLLEDKKLKPSQPKKAMEAALRKVQKPLSPAIFLQLADKVSLNRCADAKFERFRNILQEWFGLA